MSDEEKAAPKFAEFEEMSEEERERYEKEYKRMRHLAIRTLYGTQIRPEHLEMVRDLNKVLDFHVEQFVKQNIPKFVGMHIIMASFSTLMSNQLATFRNNIRIVTKEALEPGQEVHAENAMLINYTAYQDAWAFITDKNADICFDIEHQHMKPEQIKEKYGFSAIEIVDKKDKKERAN